MCHPGAASADPGTWKGHLRNSKFIFNNRLFAFEMSFPGPAQILLCKILRDDTLITIYAKINPFSS